MHIINVTVRDKIATHVGDVYYVCGNSDFVVHFDFDEEWDALDVKTARFICEDGSFRNQVFSGSECPVPIISNTNNLRVGVFAGNLSTTTPARVPAVKSILCPGGMPAAPEEDAYHQAMEEMAKVAHEARTKAAESAQSAEEAAASAKEAAQAAEMTTGAVEAAKDAQAAAQTAKQSETAAASSAENAEKAKQSAIDNADDAEAAAKDAQASAQTAGTLATQAATSAKNAEASAQAAQESAKVVEQSDWVGNVYVVTTAYNDDGQLIADRSPRDIERAFSNGMTPLLLDGSTGMWFIGFENYEGESCPAFYAWSEYDAKSGAVQYKAYITSDCVVYLTGTYTGIPNPEALTITKGGETATYDGSKAASVEVPDVFIVTVTSNKASHTQDEIRAAAAAGKACLMIWKGNVYTYAGEKVAAGENCPSFDAGMKNSPDGLTGLYYQHACVTSDGGCVTLGTAAPARTVRALYIRERGSSSYTTYDGSEARHIDIPDTLPNPNALTIGGVAYDGSKAVSVFPAPADATATAYLRWNGTGYVPATIAQLKSDLGLT